MPIDDRRTQRQLELRVGRDGLDAMVSLSLDDARLGDPQQMVEIRGGEVLRVGKLRFKRLKTRARA